MSPGPNIEPPEGFDLYDTASERRERKERERRQEEGSFIEEFRQCEKRLKDYAKKTGKTLEDIKEEGRKEYVKKITPLIEDFITKKEN